jgi:hypothetical protein
MLSVGASIKSSRDPFVEAGRVGYNHPVYLEEEIKKVCLGPDEDFSEDPTWLYAPFSLDHDSGYSGLSPLQA